MKRYSIDQITDLRTVAGTSPETRIVAEPWHVRISRLQRMLVVPKGFEFDLDSVPRLPLIYLLFKGRSGLRAPCLHDYLYQHNPFNIKRSEADLVYWDAMRSFGVPMIWSQFHFLGVRLGGWRGWNQYRDRDGSN